jgi:hypothetical protein
MKGCISALHENVGPRSWPLFSFLLFSGNWVANEFAKSLKMQPSRTVFLICLRYGSYSNYSEKFEVKVRSASIFAMVGKLVEMDRF